MITFQEEPFAKFFKDGQALFVQHHKELALNQEKIEMEMDEQKYQALEDAKILFVLTVRDQGYLIGYLVAFIMPHMHYKSAGLMALTDMYFIRPLSRRGAGARMFIEFEKRMKARGVVQIMTSCKKHQDHSQLLEKLGWNNTDFTFTKVLI